MAQLVIAAAGAAIGSALAPVGFAFLGMSGAQLGWMAGSILGSALAPKQRTYGPRLDELRVTGSEYGGGIAWVAGAPRVAGDLIWASDRREIAKTEEVGKGGGAEYTSYTYEIDCLYLLADQPGAIVTRIWDNGKLIWTSLASSSDATLIASEQQSRWRRFTVYSGADDQAPDPTYEAAVTNAPGYTRRLTLFIEGLQLGSSGTLPNLTFEVASNGEVSADFLRRYAVADTGRQFADAFTVGLGRPAMLSIQPAVRVAIVDDVDTDVYVFTLAGATAGMSSRTTAENYPSVPGDGGGTVDYNYPVGLVDGQPTRVANHFYALGTRSHIRCGVKFASAWATGILPDLADCLPSGRYLGDTMPCSDGIHMLCLTAPTSAYFGNAVLDQWHIVKREGGVGVLVRQGTIAVPMAWRVTGSVAFDYTSAMLEDDLLHAWYARGAGSGELEMFRIDADDVMRLGSQMTSALLVHSFTRTSIWAESGFCVVISRQSYQAFRRAGDVIGEVSLQSVVEAICDRATMPASTYDASALASLTQPVRALAVTNGSARQALEILQASHGFDAYCTDKLYFVPRGGAAVLTVDANDLAAGDGDAGSEPFALTVNADLEIPARIEVAYKNMLADQVAGVERSDRGPAGQDSVQQMQLAIGMTPAEAKGVADAMVRDAFAARLTSQIALPMIYTRITPTDVVQVPDSDGTLYRMRVTRRSESGGIITLDVTGDDGAVVVEEMTTSEDYTAQVDVETLAATQLAALDIPLLRDAEDSPGFLVASRGVNSNWPGAACLISSDNATFTTAATFGASAVIGEATTALGDWTLATMDECSTVTVSVAHGTLSSVTRAQLLADRTLNAMLIGDEIIRFATATLASTAPNVYTLSRLLRGQRGTEWARSTHVIGDRVVLLTTAGLRNVSQTISDIGQVRWIKGVTTTVVPATVASSEFTNTGARLRPLSPVDLRLTRAVDGGVVLRWRRRSRLQSSLVGAAGITCPLGEAAERYTVEVYSDGTYSTIKRTFADYTQPNAAYTAADQIADFGAVQSTFYCRVYQLSEAVGRGFALQAAVTNSYTPTSMTRTITLGGTFASGVLITVFAGATQLAAYTTTVGDATLSGVATSLAAAIDGVGGYSASATGPAVDVEGPVGVVFVLTVTVGGTMLMGWNPVRAASLATGGEPYRANLWIGNFISGTTEPIPAGVTFTVAVENPAGFPVGQASYTTATSQLRAEVLSGLSQAVTESAALAAFGAVLTVGVSSTAGYYGVMTGPLGVTTMFVRTTVTAPFALSVSVQSNGVAPVPTDQAQVTDLVLSGTPTAGDVLVAILGGVEYSYTIAGGDDIEDAAAGLAAVIDAAAAYSAAATNVDGIGLADTVRVTGATVAVPFTYSQRVARSITTTIS